MTIEKTADLQGKNASLKGQTRFERDWTKGSIINNLWSLSWPAIVSNSMNTVGPTVDMIWVGQLGPAAIAGVGVAGMAVMFVLSMMMGLFTGLRAMVARSIGAGDRDTANHAARQALVIVAIASIILAVIGIFSAEGIMRLLRVEADVIAEGAPYLRIYFVGMVAMILRTMTDTTMQASGDSMTPMKIAVVFRVFHVIICPFLVFGWWIFPKMGVSGAALTSVLSQGLGTILGVWFLVTGRTRLQLELRDFRFDFRMIWRMVRIGIPSSLMGMQRNLSQLVLLWFIVPFGTFAVAAHTLYQRVEMILFMPGLGMGMGAGVLAGQNLGARQPERAEKGGWLAAGLVTGFMVLSSLLLLVWPQGIIGIFSKEPGLMEMASTFLRIATAGFVMLGSITVLMHCLTSVGDTMPAMLIEMSNFWLIQIPLAYYLPRVTSLGVYGVRWAMVAGIAVATVAFVTYFRLGKWKHKQI